MPKSEALQATSRRTDVPYAAMEPCGLLIRAHEHEVRRVARGHMDRHANGERLRGAAHASPASSDPNEENPMMSRIQFLTALAVALIALAGPQLLAAEVKVHDVTVVKAGDGKITLTFKGDEKKHDHDVAKDAEITLDGKKAELGDLKEGFPAKVTVDDKFVVHKIEAKSK